MQSNSRRTFLKLTAASAATGCAPQADPVKPQQTKVDEHQARSLAVKHYQHLTQGMHLRHLRTNELLPFPRLEVSDFQYAEAMENCWLVRAQPQAGWTVVARVGHGGDWVEIVRWGFVDA